MLKRFMFGTLLVASFTTAFMASRNVGAGNAAVASTTQENQSINKPRPDACYCPYYNTNYCCDHGWRLCCDW